MSNYILVVDTNVLYKNYNENPDFSSFSFSNKFEDIKRKIEELDLLEIIKIAVPQMCWEELKVHNLDEHQSKLNNAKYSFNKYKFLPEIKYEINEDIDYEAKLNSFIKDYKDYLLGESSGIKIIELPLPKNSCFDKIINRAIKKEFPFHITNGHSDYGFKDVIIWESILQYKNENINNKLILFSKDNGFDESLKKEYKALFNDEIMIFRNENDLYSYLEKLAKENIADFKMSPVINYLASQETLLQEWFNTQACADELFKISDKAFMRFGKLINIEILDYEPLDIEDDYIENFWINILLKLNIQNYFDKTSVFPLIQKYRICVNIPQEEDLPILIVASEKCDNMEAKEWHERLQEIGDNDE